MTTATRKLRAGIFVWQKRRASMAFSAVDGRLVLAGNTLYGTTSFGSSSFGGSVFSINSDGTSFAVVSALGNDRNPLAGLMLSGNTLYGTTYLYRQAECGFSHELMTADWFEGIARRVSFDFVIAADDADFAAMFQLHLR